jgi:hypothetical protein
MKRICENCTHWDNGNNVVGVCMGNEFYLPIAASRKVRVLTVNSFGCVEFNARRNAGKLGGRPKKN